MLAGYRGRPAMVLQIPLTPEIFCLSLYLLRKGTKQYEHKQPEWNKASSITPTALSLSHTHTPLLHDHSFTRLHTVAYKHSHHTETFICTHSNQRTGTCTVLCLQTKASTNIYCERCVTKSACEFKLHNCVLFTVTMHSTSKSCLLSWLIIHIAMIK